MNISLLDEAIGGVVGTFGWTGAPTYGLGKSMSPVQRAKWSVAVLEELAENGEIILSASRPVDGSVDFEFVSISPAAAGLLGQPNSLVGASLRDILYADRRLGPLYAVCVQVAASGIDAVLVSTQCSWHRRASILFRVARTPTGLRVTLSCPDAQKSELEAIDALQALLEPVYRRYGECLDVRDFQLPALLMPPAWPPVHTVGGPVCHARDWT